MEDVQNSPASIPVEIDTVGVCNFRIPLWVRDKTNGKQHTVVSINMGVTLSSNCKGTHMSRFIEAIEQWNHEIDYNSVASLLTDIRKRLDASAARIEMSFPYFLTKAAPFSKNPGTMSYDCTLTGEQSGTDKTTFMLTVQVPVMTVCPCSKAISREGAHTQRTMVSVKLRMSAFTWIEDFIEIIEQSGSSPVYTLLKREDEKFVTEDAFAHPAFVEDVVRNVAYHLSEHPNITWFSVKVESQESIHHHNAFACIERTVKKS